MQLHNMCKKEHESFKEYTQRWRDLAAQVVPPMMEKETIIVMVNTLSIFHYEKMVGYAPSKLCGFGLRQWKDRCESEKRQIWSSCFDKCKKTGANEEGENEGETLAMTVIPTRSNFPSAQQCHYLANNSPSHPIIHKSHPQISHKACLLTTCPGFLNLHFSEDTTRTQHVHITEEFRDIPLSTIWPRSIKGKV